MVPAYPSRLLVGVGTMAGAALAYELVLARVLTISLWPPMGAAMLALASLGAAASGAALSTLRLKEPTAYATAFTVNALGFGLTCVGCASLAGSAILDPADLLTGFAGWWIAVSAVVLAALPIFFAANCVVLALQQSQEMVAGIFAAQLLGAGVAAIAVTAALFVVSPGSALEGVALIAVGAAWLGLLAADRRPRWLLTLTILGSLVALILIDHAEFEPAAGAAKALSRALALPGARELARRDSPLGRLQVVERLSGPLYPVPGLSPTRRAMVPEQLTVFRDGDNHGVINRSGVDPSSAAYLDELPSALPYHLLAPRPSVLILGADGGSAVLQALSQQAARVDAVEVNPQLLGLVREDFGPYTGHLYDDPRVMLHIAGIRSFVRGADERWRLIQLTLGAKAATAIGLSGGLGGTFDYTVEALADYLGHLEPGGMLAITVNVRSPPRDGLKLFATALAALEHLGVPDPPRRLAWVRGWQAATLVLKNGSFGLDELKRIRRFDRRRALEEAYLPDLDAAPGNVDQHLRRPFVTGPALALVGPFRHEFLRTYPYRIEPATDDRPYFFDFFRWSELRKLAVLSGLAGPMPTDFGYPMLAVSALMVVISVMALTLIPLGWLQYRSESSEGGHLLRIGVYFALIGAGFMLTVLAHMDRLALYLGHPVYAVPVVLAAFLIFSGIGSRLAASITRRSARGRVMLAATAFVVLSLLDAVLIPPLLERTAGAHLALKLLLVIGVAAPLALCMGLLLPLGMIRLTYAGAALVPWAFGIHRSAAVVGAVASVLFAMEFGQFAVMAVAAACYAGAAMVLR